jgi:hypothetical protein
VDELYYYVVMPYGLRNALPTFVRTMSKTFGDLIRDRVEIYVDDIVVKTKRGSTLVEDLTLVFDKLRATRTKLNPDKCVFGVSAGKLLGFLVSHRGIEANPEKIREIEAMRPPARIKDVQRSLRGPWPPLAASSQGWMRGRCPSSSSYGSSDHSLGPRRQSEPSKS